MSNLFVPVVMSSKAAVCKYALCKHGEWHARRADCGFAHRLSELELSSRYECYLSDQSGGGGGHAGVDIFYGQQYSANQLMRIFSYICQSLQYNHHLPDWVRLFLWCYEIFPQEHFADDSFEAVFKEGLSHVVSVCLPGRVTADSIMSHAIVRGGGLGLRLDCHEVKGSILDRLQERWRSGTWWSVYRSCVHGPLTPGMLYVLLDDKDHGGCRVVLLVPLLSRRLNFAEMFWCAAEHVAHFSWVELFDMPRTGSSPLCHRLRLGSQHRIVIYYAWDQHCTSVAWLISGMQGFGFVHIPGDMWPLQCSVRYVGFVGALGAVLANFSSRALERTSFHFVTTVKDPVTEVFNGVCTGDPDVLYECSRDMVLRLGERAVVHHHHEFDSDFCWAAGLRMCEAVAVAATKEGALVLNHLPRRARAAIWKRKRKLS